MWFIGMYQGTHATYLNHFLLFIFYKNMNVVYLIHHVRLKRTDAKCGTCVNAARYVKCTQQTLLKA